MRYVLDVYFLNVPIGKYRFRTIDAARRFIDTQLKPPFRYEITRRPLDFGRYIEI